MEPRPAAPRVLARADADSRPIAALEQFDRDSRLLVLDQAWWSARPLGMLWPEMDEAFVASGGGGPPTAARRPVVVIATG